MKYQAINFLTGTVFFCGLLAMNGVVLMAEETTLSIEQIDKNLAAKTADSTGMVWFTPNESNIEVDGFAWYNNDNLYYYLTPTSYDSYKTLAIRQCCHDGNGTCNIT